MTSLGEVCLITCSYAVGCFTAGYYWTRWSTGEDVRCMGSGSVGATNVGRRLGAAGFAVTFLFDFIKGFIVVAAAHRLQVSQTDLIACMVAVVAGHIWPIQLRFQGGKGIATSLGAIYLYNPVIALMLLCMFAVLYLVTRRFVLSGMIACVIAPIFAALLGIKHADIAAITPLAILVLFAHRRNIREQIALWRRWPAIDENTAAGTKTPL